VVELDDGEVRHEKLHGPPAWISARVSTTTRSCPAPSRESDAPVVHAPIPRSGQAVRLDRVLLVAESSLERGEARDDHARLEGSGSCHGGGTSLAYQLRVLAEVTRGASGAKRAKWWNWVMARAITKQ